MNEDTRHQYQMCYQGGHLATIAVIRKAIDEKEKERYFALKDGKDLTAIDAELDRLDKALDSVIGNNRHFGL